MRNITHHTLPTNEPGRDSTLKFPPVEARGSQERIFDGVEARLPVGGGVGGARGGGGVTIIPWGDCARLLIPCCGASDGADSAGAGAAAGGAVVLLGVVVVVAGGARRGEWRGGGRHVIGVEGRVRPAVIIVSRAAAAAREGVWGSEGWKGRLIEAMQEGEGGLT